MEFTAVKTFHCQELKSDYVAGLTYTARPAEEVKGDDKRAKLTRANRATLAKLLPQWMKEGKVVAGRVALAPGEMQGAGEVR